jgi:FecR-like protein/putative zinc finger protein
MTTHDFDNLLKSIRDDVPSDDTIQAAAARVRTRLETGPGDAVEVARLESCADFRALLPAYRNRTLSEARHMLVEDHLHSCVGCRRYFEGERAAVIAIRPRGRVFMFAPWALAAAAVVALYIALPPILDRTLAPSGPRATVASVDGELYRISATGATLLNTGASIEQNEEIRTAKNSRAMVRLRDGSTVEMAERSDLTVTERWRGKTVHLTRGSVMVEAAKQRSGRLEISTPDALVSVKGTIFEVSSGTKGSRVSVVEGEVKVDQDGASALLHRGDQKTTSQNMTTTSVAEDIGWSQNSAKYLALLGELSAIQKRIEQIPGPGLRYRSKLAALLPENTMVFASIPNLGPTLAEATSIFEERVQQSAVLREWWNEKETQQLKSIVDQVRTFSDYLGDEIVLAVPAGPNPTPLVIAETRRPELRQFLEQRFAQLKGSGAPMLVDNPRSTGAVSNGPLVMVHGNVVALSMRPDFLTRIASLADAGANGGFLATPFGERIAQSYQSGAGWLFAVDMEQIAGGIVSSSSAMNTAGLDNVKYLMIERKENLGRTENSACLSFAGARHGLASWLAAPGPMGTLDFVSPEATFASSFVIKNPGTLLAELIGMVGSNSLVSDLQQQTGVNLLTDIAQNLGGEITVALDGPLLPTPSWKIAIEVDNPARIEWAIEQAVATAAHDYPDLKVTAAQSNGLAYYSVTLPKIAYTIDYTFTDGYMLLAPSTGLLESAIATRASGLTLAHSAAFRAQLPQDGHTNFSALMYYNMGSTVGPLIDQLKSGDLMTAEQKKSIALFDTHREPGLIYAYGEPDRITVASRGSFFGLGLDSLVGLNAKGAAALPQVFSSVLPPVLNLHATSH